MKAAVFRPGPEMDVEKKKPCPTSKLWLLPPTGHEREETNETETRTDVTYRMASKLV